MFNSKLKIYEGMWINNLKEGKAIEIYPNGKYDGLFASNKKNGKG